MSLKLTYKTIKLINTPFVGSRNRTFISSCPFTEHTGSITVILHYLGNDYVFGVIRMLSHHWIFFVITIHHDGSVTPILFISTHFTVTGMLSCHKRSTGRCTDRTSWISLSKAHTLFGHIINIRSTDIWLTVTTQVTISHIITHNVYDIWLHIMTLLCISTQWSKGKSTAQP